VSPPFRTTCRSVMILKDQDTTSRIYMLGLVRMQQETVIQQSDSSLQPISRQEFHFSAFRSLLSILTPSAALGVSTFPKRCTWSVMPMCVKKIRAVNLFHRWGAARTSLQAERVQGHGLQRGRLVRTISNIVVTSATWLFRTPCRVTASFPNPRVKMEDLFPATHRIKLVQPLQQKVHLSFSHTSQAPSPVLLRNHQIAPSMTQA